MKCVECRHHLAAGAEARKMIVEYRQDDALVLYGYQMPAGPIAAAVGALTRAWHHKCFHIARRRDARGGVGRVLDAAPTGYDMAEAMLTRDEAAALGLDAAAAGERTAHLSQRLHRLRALAQSMGRGVGDATVTEAFQAAEHGGPYLHTHGIPLDAYQLRAHLRYAHGQPATTGIRAAHDHLHTVSTQRADTPNDTAVTSPIR